MRNGLARLALLAGAGVLTVGATCGKKSVGGTDFPPAPDFTLELVSGGTGSLSDYRGKVVVLNFWATWCPPCTSEIPDFIALQEEMGGEGLQIVGVALDEPAPVKSFVERYGVNYPVFIGTDEVEMKYGGVGAIPTTFIIAPDGTLRKKILGARSKGYFQKQARAILTE